jgi:small GTP-binding protein
MIAKKVCMIGSFSVGKTSLVARYVHSIFSDQYLTTVGVKISKKELVAKGQSVSLVLWDMEGKDEYSDINLSHLRGAMGLFLVADGLRRETLDEACALQSVVDALVGDIPRILLINKADLADLWEVSDSDITRLQQQGFEIMKTSAKTGHGIDAAFLALTEAMI